MSKGNAVSRTRNVPPEPSDEIELRLCRYLERHPQAADTLDGIAAFWLDLPLSPATRRRCSAALERLERSGHVRRVEGRGGTLWRAARAKAGG